MILALFVLNIKHIRPVPSPHWAKLALPHRSVIFVARMTYAGGLFRAFRRRSGCHRFFCSRFFLPSSGLEIMRHLARGRKGWVPKGSTSTSIVAGETTE